MRPKFRLARMDADDPGAGLLRTCRCRERPDREETDVLMREGKQAVVRYPVFGFPHVNEALEPSGEYFLGHEELRPCVNPEGPPARIIR